MKFHFLHNQIQSGVLGVVYYNTKKQLTDVLTNAIKTKHFIHLSDAIYVVDFNLEYGLRDGVKV